jgi:hypothetical protein
LGLLAHLFGLHPWDIERLTVADFNQYVVEAKAWVEARKGDD